MQKDYKKIVLQRIRRLHLIILYPIIQFFVKERENEVLFLTESRDDFSGNFLFVKEEIEKRGSYNITGSFLNNISGKRKNSELKQLSKIAKAKYIFLDDFMPMVYTLKLKKSKKLVQLWHALGAFKTVGYARLGKEGGPKGYTLTHRNYTDVIVSSKDIIKDYAKAFGINKEKVHALGVPRTDIFFDKKYKDKITKDLYKKYPKLKDKKVILFAPTFRGSGKKSAHYDFDKLDFNILKEKFSKDYVCIIKMHPFIHNKPNYSFDNDFYLDLSSEREINDLLFITDILITDYSSVIFEYSFFKKPVIFFIPDYKEYIASRDFFYDFDKYNYGTCAYNMNDLINQIKNSKVDIKKIDSFYKYFCSACDGKSTKKVVDYILGSDKK